MAPELPERRWDVMLGVLYGPEFLATDVTHTTVVYRRGSAEDTQPGAPGQGQASCEVTSARWANLWP